MGTRATLHRWALQTAFQSVLRVCRERSPQPRRERNLKMKRAILANHGGPDRARCAGGRQRGGGESGDLRQSRWPWLYRHLSLDVNGGQAVSGTGTLSILGLNNAPIVLITASTPGNEAIPTTSASVATTARTTSTSTKPTRSAATACCSTSARPRRNGASIPSSPSGRKGRATPLPSPATSAGPSIRTSKAARWPLRPARFLSPQLGRWAC